VEQIQTQKVQKKSLVYDVNAKIFDYKKIPPFLITIWVLIEQRIQIEELLVALS
jgi:hypothetical protein